MEKKSDKLYSDEWLKDIPLRSGNEGYQQDEMISCKKCQRNNPPTRLDCMYCGVELEFDKDQSQLIKPVLRKTEGYEEGYNLIYLANLDNWNDKQVNEVAKMIRLEESELKKIASSKKKLPIARAETKKETRIVSQRLSEIGIETLVVPDETFKLKNISKRLRGLEFQDDKLILILFNNDEIAEIKKEDLSMIVVGAIFEKKLESTEKYAKKGENKVLETSEISSDEILIDIYSKEDLISYRISLKGFDFSCLEKEKKLLAIENIKILINKLKSFAPNAQFDDDYLKMRDNLANIWEVEEKNESKGMKRKSLGSFNKVNLITTSNLLQFTKYSRLQKLLQNENNSEK